MTNFARVISIVAFAAPLFIFVAYPSAAETVNIPKKLNVNLEGIRLSVPVTKGLSLELADSNQSLTFRSAPSLSKAALIINQHNRSSINVRSFTYNFANDNEYCDEENAVELCKIENQSSAGSRILQVIFFRPAMNADPQKYLDSEAEKASNPTIGSLDPSNRYLLSETNSAPKVLFDCSLAKIDDDKFYCQSVSLDVNDISFRSNSVISAEEFDHKIANRYAIEIQNLIDFMRIKK